MSSVLEQEVLLTSLEFSRELWGTFPQSSSSGTSLSSISLKIQLVSTMAFSNRSSSSGGPAPKQCPDTSEEPAGSVPPSLHGPEELTLVRCLPSKKVPELLSILGRRLGTLLDGLHVACSAAHVLLGVDVVGQLCYLQTAGDISSS